MAPVAPIGQGGLSYQRPAQHPGVWQFADAVEDAPGPASVPTPLPAASLPRISLQVQEMLSRPEALEAFGTALPRLTTSEEEEARQDGDRRMGDRRARPRTGQQSRRDAMPRA